MPARLLSQVQQGFQALMDGEAYVHQRQQALEGRSPSAGPPPSLVDKVVATGHLLLWAKLLSCAAGLLTSQTAGHSLTIQR